MCWNYNKNVDIFLELQQITVTKQQLFSKLHVNAYANKQ